MWRLIPLEVVHAQAQGIYYTDEVHIQCGEIWRRKETILVEGLVQEVARWFDACVGEDVVDMPEMLVSLFKEGADAGPLGDVGREVEQSSGRGRGRGGTGIG